jgi:hypothetical protein
MKRLFFVPFFLFCAVLSAQEKPVLQFPESGTFRIAQFADLHYNSKDTRQLLKIFSKDYFLTGYTRLTGFYLISYHVNSVKIGF